ncbi:MAG: T9SS type A sorting domain-containing protein [Bacteroidetes bacterium]|nr:T9SS type A sorting domain-containing protein [Bacteroidota bacterium]
MKNILVYIAAAICLVAPSNAPAQSIDPSEYLDVNQIIASHSAYGEVWFNNSTYTQDCRFPKASPKPLGALSTLWFTAVDDSGKTHLSAMLYRIGGKFDFQPGPLNDSGNTNSVNVDDWSKIWKVNTSTVDSFRSALRAYNFNELNKSKYDVIKTWPAYGNNIAIGTYGLPLSELVASGSSFYDYAPFVDVDGDGIYSWAAGDYPKMKGDQMIWWVYNDRVPSGARSSGGKPLGIEVHVLAYAYNRGTAADRMLFYEYSIYNKSGRNYHNAQIGVVADIDLGFPFNDYVAYDSVHRAGIQYNATKDDGSYPGSFGTKVPIASVSILEMPGDIYPNGMQAAAAFNIIPADSSGVLGADTNYINYMQGRKWYGAPSDWGKYAYPITKGAVECDSNHIPGDRRFVITTQSFSLPKNGKIKLASALVVTEGLGLACPDSNLFSGVTALSDTAWDIYWYPLPHLGVASTASANSILKVYPNPTSNYLVIELNGKQSSHTNVVVFDVLGRAHQLPWKQTLKGIELQTAALPSGFYSVQVRKDNQLSSTHFVKE